jgi:phage gpG-like protein
VYRVGIRSNAGTVARRMQSFPGRVAEMLRGELDRQNRTTITHVARTRLSFPRASNPGLEGLRVQTGTLRRGLVAGFIPAYNHSNTTIVGGISNRVRYASIHEFGGTIPPRGIIRPKTAKALRFVVNGRVLFRKWVNQTEPSTIPARAPVRKGLDERMPVYRQNCAAIVQREFRGLR